jgi:hypothetical protein
VLSPQSERNFLFFTNSLDRLRSERLTINFSGSFKRLFSLISQDTGHIFLLIDGLDEYQGNPTDTIELLKTISSPTVKICASSRPWQVFKVAFKKASKLQVQDLTYGDIERYVNDKLLGNAQMQQLCDLDPVGAPELVAEIVEKAAGVFLWVTLVVNSFLSGLTNGDSISYLRKRLEEMPSEIENLYGYMLSKIDPIYYEEARLLFSIMWLASEKAEKYSGDALCALRLSFAMENKEDLKARCEIMDKERAVGIVDLMDSRLKICCAGLLEIPSLHTQYKSSHLVVPGNRPVQYIHRTARDLLAPESPQTRPPWVCRSLADDIPVRMMRANVVFLQSCFRKADLTETLYEFLNSFIESTMWLACMAEREKSYHHEEILDTFAENVGRLLDSPTGWAGNFISNEGFDTNSKRNWCNDFLSLAVVWQLDLYVDKKLAQDNTVLEAKKGRPYLDYALRYMSKDGRPEDFWDLKTITVLLEHGGNPNLHYAVGPGAPTLYLKQSTP